MNYQKIDYKQCEIIRSLNVYRVGTTINKKFSGFIEYAIPIKTFERIAELRIINADTSQKRDIRSAAGEEWAKLNNEVNAKVKAFFTKKLIEYREKYPELNIEYVKKIKK